MDTIVTMVVVAYISVNGMPQEKWRIEGPVKQEQCIAAQQIYAAVAISGLFNGSIAVYCNPKEAK